MTHIPERSWANIPDWIGWIELKNVFQILFSMKTEFIFIVKHEIPGYMVHGHWFFFLESLARKIRIL